MTLPIAFVPQALRRELRQSASQAQRERDLCNLAANVRSVEAKVKIWRAMLGQESGALSEAHRLKVWNCLGYLRACHSNPQVSTAQPARRIELKVKCVQRSAKCLAELL